MKNINERFRKIAVDIDGVLANFHPPFLDFYNQRNNTNVTIRDIVSYDFCRVFQISQENLVREMTDFYGSSAFRRMAPISAAKQAINQLYRRNLLYVVTSRPDTIHRETAAWLGEHFPNIFLRVHFTNKYGGNGRKEKKSNFCLEHGYRIIIEDAAEEANECAERGIDAFILTRRWNEEEPLHPNVTRVKDWKEILRHLE